MIVYKIINNINKKIYIGITSKTLEIRWQQHCRDALGYTDNYIFHKAIRKYGVNNFTLSILESNLTPEEAKEKEIYYIKYYNSYYKNNGYNMTYGGDLNLHIKGELSGRAKISEKNFWDIVNLLKNTILSYKDIILKLKLNISDRAISDINAGKNWYHNELIYPIRKGKSISKVGIKNSRAKLTEKEVIEIIDLLQNSNMSQSDIGKKYNVCYNTINLINRCKTWTYLHNFKENIREKR